jgi:hypothetical protein
MLIPMAMVTEPPGARPMKKLALAFALAFAVLGGAVAVSTLATTHAAYADPSGNGH